MARFSHFWQLLGALEAVPDLVVTWDAALYDEPETGQYWAYVHAGDQLVARISNTRPAAFVLSTAPPVVSALLAEYQIVVVCVTDLEHPTIDVTRFLKNVMEHRRNWTAADFDSLEKALQEMRLLREWDDNTFIICTTDELGQVVAVEHLHLPLALTVSVTPAALTPVLQDLGQHVLTVEDWKTPNLSISAADAPDLIERLPLFGVHEGDLDAFSAERLISWLA